MVETLYWITRLDGLNVLFIVLTVISAFGVLFTGMARIIHGIEADRLFKNGLKYGIPTLMFSVAGLIFVPTTKDALLIYGVGNTIEYLRGNEKARELPDKCIEALNNYIDSLDKQNSKK